jgi:hypothetical protein
MAGASTVGPLAVTGPDRLAPPTVESTTYPA